MIPEAREVHLSRKDRKVLEACCRSPMTIQRDLKRARIVLLAAAGRSTRSIAKEVGVQPRIFSLWRHRYSDPLRIRRRAVPHRSRSGARWHRDRWSWQERGAQPVRTFLARHCRSAADRFLGRGLACGRCRARAGLDDLFAALSLGRCRAVSSAA
jgi:hypothetical protein